MAGPIYGDSFGDLSRNVQAASNARQAALANALNTAVSALSAARSHQTELQRLSQQKDQFGQEMTFRQGQEAERKTENDRNFKLAQDEAGLSERRVKVMEAAEKDRANAITPAQQREHDVTFNQADSDAAQGTFDDAAHVQKLYPNLSPAETNVLASRSQDARRQVTSDYVTANNAAQVLNTHQQLAKRIYTIDSATKELQDVKSGWFSGNGDQVQQAQSQMARLKQLKDKATRQMMQIEPIATALNKDKNVNNLVTFDPASERYVPTLATPRWMKQAVAGAPDEQVGGVNDETGDPDGSPAPKPATRTSTAGVAPAAPARTTTTTDQGPQEPTVKVRGRDGSVYNIPQSRVKDAMARGGSLLTPPKAAPEPERMRRNLLISDR